MIGVIVASNKEWEFVINYYSDIDIRESLYGSYFIKIINNKEVIFFKTGSRKIRSAGATQYLIDHYKLEKVLLIGTAAGVNHKYNLKDVLVPSIIVSGDTSFIEKGEGFNNKYVIDLDNESNIIIYSSDKPLIYKEDVENLLNNNVTLYDMEAFSVVDICKINNIDIKVIKGITDFPGDYSSDDEKQYLEYKENVNIVMKKILDNYLEKYILGE